MDEFMSQNEAMRAAADETDVHEKKGLSIVALVFGILSVIGVCCWISLIFAPVGIVTAGIALAKHYGGKGLSITGMVLSILSLIVSVVMLIAVIPIIEHGEEIARDYTQLVIEQDEVFAAYEKDKALPSYISKYAESPYAEYLAKFRIDIYDIMDALDERYRKGEMEKPEQGKQWQEGLTYTYEAGGVIVPQLAN